MVTGSAATTTVAFNSSQLQERYLHECKAFDTICREWLWKNMAKYEIPGKFTAVVKSLNKKMQARVLDEGESLETFQVINGIKQVCVLAPILFRCFSPPCWKLDFMTTQTPCSSATAQMASCLMWRDYKPELNWRRRVCVTWCLLMTVFVCLRCLWTRLQHKENGGHVSVNTPHKLLTSNHHSQWQEGANCRQIYISRLYPIQKCAYRRRGWCNNCQRKHSFLKAS